MAEQGISGTKKEVEKLSIWELCEILSYNAEQADRQRELLNQNKSKRKKR